MELILGFLASPLLGLTFWATFAVALLLLLVAIWLYAGIYYLLPRLVMKFVSRLALTHA